MDSQVKKDAKERKQKREELIDKVEETIKSVCENVKKEEGLSGEYSSTVSALAQLVEARALLD